jgi:hypothetical protein
VIRKIATIAVPLLISCAVLGAVVENSASGKEAYAIQSAHRSGAAEDYRQLRTALKDGRSVAVTVHFVQCAGPGGVKGPDVIGGLHINAFLSPQGNIAFSDVHDTLDPQNHKVTEYIRYNVAADGKVSVNTTTLASDNQVIRSVVYQCAIGEGARFTWPTG